MNVISHKAELSGTVYVPGSKSHTMRACMFASLAEGTSVIRNPLDSADCRAAARAVRSIGAEVDFNEGVWTISGAGKKAHLPENVVDCDCSGAAMYLLAPIAATFSGWSVFSGNEVMRAKPVQHLIEDLKQLGCEAYKTNEIRKGAPLIIKGPSKSGEIITKGHYSLALTGLLLSGARLPGILSITLTDPKETPYLEMTKRWFESLKMKIQVSEDYKRLSVTGPQRFAPFDRTMPSDWESIAFPLVAGIITDSEFSIEKVDTSGGQGDAAIVDILISMGADLELVEENSQEKTGTLIIRGGSKSRLPNKGKLHGINVNCSGYPDIVTTLAVAASFAEGDTVIEDVAASRKKAVDRVEIITKELAELGVDIEEHENSLVVHGSSSVIHGGTVESYGDHRVAMALAIFGLALENETVEVKDAECCATSFPGFYTTMNKVGAGFVMRN